MNQWLESYKELEYRTRWVSQVGAIVLIVIAATEIVGTIQAITVSEIGPTGIFRLIGIEELFPVMIMVLAIVRIVALIHKDGTYSWVGRFSWLMILIIVFGLVAWEFFAVRPHSPSDCEPVPGKVCFAVYDMRRASITPLASIGYVTFGIFRFAATSLMAYLRQRPHFR